MAIQVQSVKCPECSANLQISDRSAPFFCSYCGTQIIMTNDRETVHRYIDEAEVKRAETEHAIQMEKLDFMERQQAEKERRDTELRAKREKIEYERRIKIYAAIAVGAVMLLTMALNLPVAGLPLMVVEAVLLFLIHQDNKRLENVGLGDMLRIRSAVSGYSDKDYSTIEAAMSTAGFTNIKCVPLNDVIIGLRKKPGMVESVSVNGHVISSAGGKYPADSVVVISYHSFQNR